MTKDEALREAIDTLKQTKHGNCDYAWIDGTIKKCTAALAQPVQEPVKMVAYNCLCGRTMKFESVHGVVAPQRTWVELTDAEIEIIYAKCNVWDKFEYERMLEAKLKEKNT